MDKIGPYLLRKYNIKGEYHVMKDLSDQLKNQIHSQYAASLSSRDVIRAREDFRIMRSIRRKLKKQKLIIRITEKSNLFYVGRAIDFEKKVQAYREKTNAYQELTSNPLEAILMKVTRLLNDLRAKKSHSSESIRCNDAETGKSETGLHVFQSKSAQGMNRTTSS